MKRIILWTMGIAAAGAAAVYGCGLLLPRTHSIVRTLELKAPPDAVWQAITDYPAQVAWRTKMERAVRGADRNGREVWIETVDGWEIPLETVSADPPRRLVREIAGDDLAFGGAWTYEIAPTAEGCALTIREDGVVNSPVFRVMSRLMGQDTTIVQFLTDLARKYGETPRIR